MLKISFDPSQSIPGVANLTPPCPVSCDSYVDIGLAFAYDCATENVFVISVASFRCKNYSLRVCLPRLQFHKPFGKYHSFDKMFRDAKEMGKDELDSDQKL